MTQPLRSARVSPNRTISGILPKPLVGPDGRRLDEPQETTTPVFDDEHDLLEVAGTDTAIDVADACRRAGLIFLNGVGNGWRKRDLAGWLLGPYREATRHSAWERVWPPLDPSPETTSPTRIAALMDLVRIGVASMLGDVRCHRATFVTDAIRLRTIVPARSQSSILWIPVDAPRMGLERRVLALFAVDYLARPEQYVDRLQVCGECDHVRFDDTACDGCWGVQQSGVVSLGSYRSERVG